MKAENRPIRSRCFIRRLVSGSGSAAACAQHTRSPARTNAAKSSESRSRVCGMRAGLGPSEDCGDALAAADAHGLEPIARAAALDLVNQGRQNPHAGGADWMAERDAGAIDIYPVRIAPRPRLQNGQHLAGERLVDLDKVCHPPIGRCVT